MLIIIILLLLLFGGFGGYYSYGAYGPNWSGGIGIGTILLIILVFFLLRGRIG